jgi:hypothetical protein
MHPTCKYDYPASVHTYTVPLTAEQAANSVMLLTIDRNDYAGVEMPANYHPNYAIYTAGSIANQILYRTPA